MTVHLPGAASFEEAARRAAAFEDEDLIGGLFYELANDGGSDESRSAGNEHAHSDVLLLTDPIDELPGVEMPE